jgi:hypothetical protein
MIFGDQYNLNKIHLAFAKMLFIKKYDKCQ